MVLSILLRLLVFCLALAASCVHAQQKVLRFIPQADLRILDPIATTAYITRNHAHTVYDTLFATDAARARPIGGSRRRPISSHCCERTETSASRLATRSARSA
jgi:ABC-type oligopeptide transport system substrate-binding subunit